MPWCVYINLEGKPEPDLSVRDFRDAPKKPEGPTWPDLVAYPPGDENDRSKAEALANRLGEDGYSAHVAEFLRVPAL